MDVPGAHSGIRSPGLGLQTVGSYHVCVGIESKSYGRVANALNCGAISEFP